MTIRDALHQMLAGMGAETDPAQVLADHGHPDVPPEAFAQALGHLSDTAPIELADSLAPLTTRSSNIPFDSDELPTLDPDLEFNNPADIYDTLSKVGLESFGTSGLFDDSDPELFDEADATFGRRGEVSHTHDETTETPDTDVPFGLGDHQDQYGEDVAQDAGDHGDTGFRIEQTDHHVSGDAGLADNDLVANTELVDHTALNLDDEQAYDEDHFDPFGELSGDDPADLDFD